jgi:hypothetical membrane protein
MLAPVILTFFILMDITIAVLAVIMKIKGFAGDLTVVVIMTFLALISILLLARFLKSDTSAADPY